jgi:hypothetical protein
VRRLVLDLLPLLPGLAWYAAAALLLVLAM